MEDKIELLRRLRHHKKANEYEIRVKNMKHLIDIIEGRAGKRKMMRDRRSLKTQVCCNGSIVCDAILISASCNTLLSEDV